MDLDEVEILLLAHELQLNKFKKSSTLNLISLNLTHVTPTLANFENVQSTSVESSSTHTSAPRMDPDMLQFHGGLSWSR